MSQCSPSRKQNMAIAKKFKTDFSEESKQGKCGNCEHFFLRDTKGGSPAGFSETTRHQKGYCTYYPKWVNVSEMDDYYIEYSDDFNARWEMFCTGKFKHTDNPAMYRQEIQVDKVVEIHKMKVREK